MVVAKSDNATVFSLSMLGSNPGTDFGFFKLLMAVIRISLGIFMSAMPEIFLWVPIALEKLLLYFVSKRQIQSQSQHSWLFVKAKGYLHSLKTSCLFKFQECFKVTTNMLGRYRLCKYEENCSMRDRVSECPVDSLYVVGQNLWWKRERERKKERHGE